MLSRRHAGLASWLAAGALLAALPAAGATLEGLLMPGPLASGHAELESDCGSCHDRSNRARQRELCLACHKDVAADLAARRGLHGRRGEIQAAQCSACHSEHRGREARLAPQPDALFDHVATDFQLDGAHRLVACGACHAAGKRYSEAPTGCIDCHRRDEPHDGQLGTDCASCHGSQRWNAVDFDHGQTRFALQARHAELPCAACHANNRWRDTPRACASCHTPDDVHRGTRGTDCASCHTERSWSEARFDHEKETGFALLGAHRDAACQSCHRSGRFEDKLPRECSGCHRAVDTHAGRMGNECASCHGTTQWRVADFNHEQKAKFALTGAHASLGCHSCHVVPLSDSRPSRDCADCHRAEDAHAGTVDRQCAACHDTKSWKDGLRFEHDLTDFALLGQHATVPCASCHVSLQFGKTESLCSSCHRASDVHQGALGTDCARCHHPNGWNQWQFDHAKESGFALTGAHARAQCGSCHQRPPGSERMARDCVSCHATEDPHLGQFGRRCESCHSTISFLRAVPQ